jgi:hypothetical protein
VGLLQVMIDAVPVIENEQGVLAHPDYDVQCMSATERCIKEPSFEN